MAAGAVAGYLAGCLASFAAGGAALWLAEMAWRRGQRRRMLKWSQGRSITRLDRQ